MLFAKVIGISHHTAEAKSARDPFLCLQMAWEANDALPRAAWPGEMPAGTHLGDRAVVASSW